MKRMTKQFLAVALMMVVGTLAHAVGVPFNSTSLPRQMRQDGLTETAGEVQLTAAVGGGTIAAGSSIDIVFSVAITNNSALSTNNISLANNVVCTNAAACPTAASIQGSNTVRLAFAAATNFNAADAIILSRVRVNANAALGVGSVVATMAGGSSDPVNNPITFSDPQRQVGVLNATITVTTTSSSLPNGGVPALLRTCAFPNDAIDDLFIRITEVFPGALTSQAKEATLSNALPATNGSNLTFTIGGVPAGLTLAFTTNSQPTAGGSLAFGAPTPSSSVDQTIAGAPQSFSFPVTAEDGSLVERMTFQFSLKPTTTSTTNPLAVAAIGSPAAITAIVQVTPITTTDTIIPRFVANQVGPQTVATITDCTTRILMTWAATVADVETGVAIVNTSNDDAAFGAGAAFGATPQNGTCTLTGYPASGATPVSFTTASINAGSSLAFLLSATTGFSNFTGYVLTVCNFEAAHAFAFITNGRGTVSGPTLAQGYVANIIQPGTRPTAAGASESLGN